MLNDFSHKWWAFIGIALLSFGCYLDYTVVNVALPTIQKELQAELIQLQWVMNIYFLALCILATIMGRCGDLYGRRRVFYIGVNIFAIASLIAGLSTNISWLIFGRFLQGIGAAIVFPLGPSLLPEVFPENERGKAIAWLGSLGGIALALGPMLGGIIVAYWGWRWIFFINIPIILVGYLFSFKSIKESLVKHISRELDWFGMLLLALTVGGIVMSLINSQASGWLNVLTLVYLVVGIVSGVILFKVERKKINPLLDFNDFSNLMFYAGAILCFLAGVLSAVALFFDPLYLQVIRGQSPEFSGFVLFAIPIAVFVVAFMVGWLIDQLGIINTIIIGLTLAILACFLHIFFSNNTPLWYIIIAFICLGSMWAMGNTVPLISAQTAVGPTRSSAATGTMVTMFNIGGSIGLAIAVVVYHFTAIRSLKYFSQMHMRQISFDQFLQLEKLISNPAQSLKLHVGTFIHSLFSDAFMHGFSGVMWFLFGLSILMLITVLTFKVSKKHY
jgi:EmrB/QacA subfamily drug resistance transporter